MKADFFYSYYLKLYCSPDSKTDEKLSVHTYMYVYKYRNNGVVLNWFQKKNFDEKYQVQLTELHSVRLTIMQFPAIQKSLYGII